MKFAPRACTLQSAFSAVLRDDELGGSHRERLGNELGELRGKFGKWGHCGVLRPDSHGFVRGYGPRKAPGRQVLVQSLERTGLP